MSKTNQIQFTVLELVALLMLIDACKDEGTLRALQVIRSQVLAALRRTQFS